MQYLDLTTNTDYVQGGTSKGTLVKWVIGNKHIKTGRLSVRGYSGSLGIEPVIEVIVYRLAKAMGIKVADEIFGIAKFKIYGKEYESIVNISKDFKQGKELIELADIYRMNMIKYPSYEEVINTLGDSDGRLYQMLYLDYIICNEDRHSKNVAWLMDSQGYLTLSPIYDNGYSLLFDDIEGMRNDYIRAIKRCVSNAPIYHDSFDFNYKIISEKNRYNKMLNLKNNFNSGIRQDTIRKIVSSTKEEYFDIISNYRGIKNIPLDNKWWVNLEEFLIRRVKDARNI